MLQPCMSWICFSFVGVLVDSEVYKCVLTWSASIAGKQCRRFARIDTRSGALVEGWNIFPAGKLPEMSHVFLTLRYTRIVLRCKQRSNGGKADPKAAAGNGVAHPGYQAPLLRADMSSSFGFICSSRWQVSRAMSLSRQLWAPTLEVR